MDIERRNALAARVVVLLLCAAASATFAALVPLFWHDKLYIDGLTIIQTPPRLEWFGSSYSSAALLLSPMLLALRMMGVQLDYYGLRYSDDLLLANGLFGLLFLLGIGLFVLRWRVRMDMRNTAFFFALVVLFAPFFFSITKEVVPFAMASVALMAFRNGWLGVTGTAWFYAVLLTLCGVFFRMYYLAYAALLMYNLWLWRRPRWLIAGYLVAALMIVVLHAHLPLDLLNKGRATYLEDVAASRIKYYFDDGSAIGFLANRMLTFAMLLAPLNLLAVSLSYAPFVLLQIFLTWKTLEVLRRPRDSVRVLAASAVLAFTMISALYEPDFGSYFRHKVGILLFMLILVLDVEWRPRRNQL